MRRSKLVAPAVALVLCSAIAGSVQASPERDLTPVGQGEMHWLFWKLYDIRLLSSDGEYREGRYPLALAIRYAREIDANDLVDATLDEWQRLRRPWQPQWASKLRQLWPSVTPGDELVLRVEADGSSHFYYNDDLLGALDDPDFAPAFLAIWLSSETREPDLRLELLGQRPGESDA